MKDLIVTAIQPDMVWENPEANRKHLTEMIKSIQSPTDLIVLPEMFTTGFTMQPEKHAEVSHPAEMKTLNWMRELASKANAVITGSVSVKDENNFYNRLLWVKPNGEFSSYDKRHLFSFGDEHNHYTRGEKILLEEINGWKILPLICYDLRFPEWSRNKLVNEKPLYDVLIYSANWPTVRSESWKKLLPARAIENQCYVVGLNRVGIDGNNQPHTGDSAFFNPRGEYLQQFTTSKEEVRSQIFTWSELEDFRMKFPVLADAD